jgi:aminoglycoside phosphotransferase (APT) family kinase protein
MTSPGPNGAPSDPEPGPAAAGAPAAEIEIDARLAARLIGAQCPRFAALAVSPLDSGWDNAMFRVGDAYSARFPRRAVAAPLLAKEQIWLPTIAARLPLPTPAPAHAGSPGEGYPWPWSLLPWIAGAPVHTGALAAGEELRWADFLSALHAPAPAGAPVNPHRGVPLAARADNVGARLERLSRAGAATPAVRALWETALAAAPDEAACWIHGDLHALNVLAADGRLSGVIDWGDMAVGDRATDLASIWMLFADPLARVRVRRAYRAADAATWARAQGWAVFFGLVLLEEGLVNSPRHAALGAAILARLTADA